MLHGITLVRNGTRLGYPYEHVINSLKGLCDRVIVNVDPTSTDNTLEKVKRLEVEVFPSVWNMKNTGDGRELASQANFLLDLIPPGDVVVYLQADEILHEKDFPLISTTIKETLKDKSGESYTAWELYRGYFWKNLTTIRLDWSMYLSRIFVNGAGIVDGDGMGTKRTKGRAYRIYGPMIHHYSRVGDPSLITERVSVLDGLFHPHETIPSVLPIYDFETREFDCYSSEESPVLKEATFSYFSGTHPKGIRGFYEVER